MGSVNGKMKSLAIIFLSAATAAVMGSNPCQNNEEVYFPDPEDCSWFYECVDGSVVGHIKCPDGLLWNNDLNTCDFPWNTECHTGGSDGESVCQQHGFDAAQCWAIGCCHWNYDTESCWSSVGNGPCQTSSPCPSSDPIESCLSHGCYHFVTESMNWFCARQTCEHLQGHLVKIETLEENEELYNEVVRLQMTNITTSPWIGLNDISTIPNPIDMWVWTDGSRPNFTNWYYGQPDPPPSEHCAGMHLNSEGKWHDFSCDLPKTAICEL